MYSKNLLEEVLSGFLKFKLTTSAGSAKTIALNPGPFNVDEASFNYNSTTPEDSSVNLYRRAVSRMTTYGVNVDAVLNDGNGESKIDADETITVSFTDSDRNIELLHAYLNHFPLQIQQMTIQSSTESVFDQEIIQHVVSPMNDMQRKKIDIRSAYDEYANDKSLLRIPAKKFELPLAFSAVTTVTIPESTSVEYTLKLNPYK